MINRITSKPHFKLMRIHNLTGAWLLLWPCLWGLVLASTDITQLLWIPVFVFGALIMRSAGCIINDIIDINLDKRVNRTKERPLANGEITIMKAIFLLSILLSIGLFILVTMGELSVLLGFIAMVLVVIYPFSKYCIKYPQFILGLIFNFGALISWSTIQGKMTLASLLLYIGSFFWIAYYDTIYAHQDKEDDEKVGVNSTSLTIFGSKEWLKRFYQLAIVFWTFAGVLSTVNISYYFFLLGIWYLLHKQLKTIDLDNTEDCMSAFQFNAKIGLILFIGACLGKIHEFI